MDIDSNITEPLASSSIDEPIDPGFSVDPDAVIDPGFSVDPDFSVRPPFIPDWAPIVPDRYPVIPDRPSPIINIFPKPVIPCYFCNTQPGRAGSVRFLNASTGYNAFSVYVNNQLVTTDLNSAEITQYTQFSPGFYTVTIMGSNGYVYVQKPVSFSNGMTTVAIVNSNTGLDLTTIQDLPCNTPNASSCIRVANLAYYSGPVSVEVNNITFTNVAFTQVADFSRVRPGNYRVSVSRTSRPGNTLVTTYVNLNANRVYTLYVLNWSSNPDTIRTLLVEDRR